MNEQLLLSKAFWSLDEYNQAVANLLELCNRIEDSYYELQENEINYEDLSIDRISASDFEIYLKSIVVFIESTPKYVGVFDSYHAPTYRGFNFRDPSCHKFFERIFRTYCYITVFGKELKVFEGTALTRKIKYNDYLKEYRKVYSIEPISFYGDIMFFESLCSEDFHGYGYNKSTFYNDTKTDVEVFIPLLTIIDSKIGYHKSYKCYFDFYDLENTVGGFEKYLSPIYKLEEYKDLITKYKNYNKVKEEYKELDEKISSIKEKINKSDEEKKQIELQNTQMSNKISSLESKLFGKKKAKEEASRIREQINSNMKVIEVNNEKILKLKEELTQLDEQCQDISRIIEKHEIYLPNKLNNMLQDNMQLFDYEWEN